MKSITYLLKTRKIEFFLLSTTLVLLVEITNRYYIKTKSETGTNQPGLAVLLNEYESQITVVFIRVNGVVDLSVNTMPRRLNS